MSLQTASHETTFGPHLCMYNLHLKRKAMGARTWVLEYAYTVDPSGPPACAIWTQVNDEDIWALLCQDNFMMDPSPHP
jgi:hypothetical protein